ncbi:MAG: GntR family transcriptional regulator, transcriptional repressor for pyruvate dehydrogenase complex [Actinomycetota bacterium]|nr:GntR family transcriptional regulator, transcriptional repressor for pyruvate dehydrogenase complex [Actinomycetota bacterium]
MTESGRARRSSGSRQGAVDFSGIEPLTVTRLADDVADRIRKLIISENLSEGTRLPSERELAERFGTSRPTVSQSLRTLALMGLVEIRRGSGAYVLRRPESMVTASVNLMLDLDETSVSHLMQLRLWLETLGVQHAATREPALSEDEVADIRTALDRLKSASDKTSEWIAEDTVFHATIVRSAGNPYLASLYESVHTAVISYEYRYWVESETVPGWLRKASPDELMSLHEPIALAVIERDSEAARVAVLNHHTAMSEHLRATRRPVKRQPGRSRSHD